MLSSNPRRRSSCHVLSSTPYFTPSHEVFPALHRCGGSNTTRRKLSSGNGISRKSAIKSGFTSNLRPSHRVLARLRLSMNTAAGCSLSNQNIREPQQASSICFIVHQLRILVFDFLHLAPPTQKAAVPRSHGKQASALSPPCKNPCPPRNRNTSARVPRMLSALYHFPPQGQSPRRQDR